MRKEVWSEEDYREEGYGEEGYRIYFWLQSVIKRNFFIYTYRL